MEVEAKCRTIQIGKAKSHTAEHPSFQVVAEMYVTSKGMHQGQTYVWYGSLRGGAIPITERALRELGYTRPLADVMTIRVTDVPRAVRLSLEQTERGYWSAKGIYPLQRDLGHKLTEGEEDALRAMLLAAAPSAEPGASDATDPADAPKERMRQAIKRVRQRVEAAESDDNPFRE